MNRQNPIVLYIQNEPLLQSATLELTSALSRLVERLEANDRPGLTLSMDQVALMGELALERFDPPPGTWTTAWTALAQRCRELAGLAPGVLQDDLQALKETERTLQSALDHISPLSSAYSELEIPM